MAPNVIGTKRLAKENRQLQLDPNPYFRAACDEDDVRTWYFILRGAKDTVYEGGFYIGKLVFPDEYPFGAPSVYMITPNDRFEINQKLCLSISDFHPG